MVLLEHYSAYFALLNTSGFVITMRRFLCVYVCMCIVWFDILERYFLHCWQLYRSTWNDIDYSVHSITKFKDYVCANRQTIYLNISIQLALTLGFMHSITANLLFDRLNRSSPSFTERAVCWHRKHLANQLHPFSSLLGRIRTGNWGPENCAKSIFKNINSPLSHKDCLCTRWIELKYIICSINCHC